MKLTEKGFKILDEASPLWLEAEDQILNESKKLSYFWWQRSNWQKLNQKTYKK